MTDMIISLFFFIDYIAYNNLDLDTLDYGSNNNNQLNSSSCMHIFSTSNAEKKLYKFIKNQLDAKTY